MKSKSFFILSIAYSGILFAAAFVVLFFNQASAMLIMIACTNSLIIFFSVFSFANLSFKIFIAIITFISSAGAIVLGVFLVESLSGAGAVGGSLAFPLGVSLKHLWQHSHGKISESPKKTPGSSGVFLSFFPLFLAVLISLAAAFLGVTAVISPASCMVMLLGGVLAGLLLHFFTAAFVKNFSLLKNTTIFS